MRCSIHRLLLPRFECRLLLFEFQLFRAGLHGSRFSSRIRFRPCTSTAHRFWCIHKLRPGCWRCDTLDGSWSVQHDTVLEYQYPPRECPHLKPHRSLDPGVQARQANGYLRANVACPIRRRVERLSCTAAAWLTRVLTWKIGRFRCHRCACCTWKVQTRG